MRRIGLVVWASICVPALLVVGCAHERAEPVRSVGTAPCGLESNGQLVVKGLEVLGVDPHPDGSLVRLRLEVVDRLGVPRNELRAGRDGNFQVCDDGRRDVSGESLTDARRRGKPTPITLILDASLSLEQDGALTPVRNAASALVAQLSDSERFDLAVYRFASEVERIPGIEQYSATTAFGRWTSFYAALSQAERERPGSVLVVFTDGADNYSDDALHGQDRTMSFRDLELVLRAKNARVHCVGLGRVDSYLDEQRVPTRDVLTRLAFNGSVRFAETVDDLPAAFDEIARRVAATYDLDFLSQYRDGTHTLHLAVYDGESSGIQMVQYAAKGATSPRPAPPRSTAPQNQPTLPASTAVAQRPCPSDPEVLGLVLNADGKRVDSVQLQPAVGHPWVYAAGDSFSSTVTPTSKGTVVGSVWIRLSTPDPTLMVGLEARGTQQRHWALLPRAIPLDARSGLHQANFEFVNVPAGTYQLIALTRNTERPCDGPYRAIRGPELAVAGEPR